MSFFNQKSLKDIIEYSNENKGKDQLEAIYKDVPSGSCAGCGSCCMESVGANFAEFVNIYDHLEKNDMIEEAYERIFNYYFKEYSKKMPCPFKNEDNMCLIYEARPLNCRIYGNWQEKDYESNYDRIKGQNVEIAREIEDRYGLRIPSGIVGFKIDYCKEFVPGDGYMTKDQRLELHDRMVSLDSKLIIGGGFDVEFRDRGIVEYFIELKFNPEMAFSMKVKIARDVKDKGRIIDRLVNIQKYIK